MDNGKRYQETGDRRQETGYSMTGARRSRSGLVILAANVLFCDLLFGVVYSHASAFSRPI